MTFQDWVTNADAKISAEPHGVFHRHTQHVSDRAYWAGIGCYVIVEPKQTSGEAFDLRAHFESVNVSGRINSESDSYAGDDAGVSSFVERTRLFFKNAPSAETHR